MNTPYAFATLAALALSLAACSGTATPDSPTTTSKTSVGGVVLIPMDAAATAADADGACAPTAEFTDVADVADSPTLTIAGDDGHTVAEGTISANSVQGDTCSPSFFIDPVEAGKGTYVVTVGDHEAATFSAQDLFAGGERRSALGVRT